MASILEPLRAAAASHPDKLLYAFLDGDGRVTESYTYGAFLQRTTAIASYIQRTVPMPVGSRVLLVYPPGLEMICGFFACVRLGLIPVPVPPPARHGFQASRDRTDLVARDCNASAVLTDRSAFSFGRAHVSTIPRIVSTDADTAAGTGCAERHSDILFLQYTSGSTSDPRGVMVTHDNILDNCDAVVDHLPIGVSWLPQYHDMGLIGYYLFFALKGGTTYGFSPADFIKRPALWLETISTYRGTASSAPNFAYEYCLRPGKVPAATLERLDLRSLRFLMTAAEPVRADVCRDFVHRFEPCGLNPKSFFSAYGLAECTLAVSNYGRATLVLDRAALQRNRIQRAGEDAAAGDTTTLVSCGRPIGTTDVKIVDVTEAPREAAEGTVGEVWIRGRSKCRGYWQRPELTAATFEACLPADSGPAASWLRSGDLGFCVDHELYVCGRLKDVIIVRGRNYYPQDIEAVIEAHPEIRRGCVAAFAGNRADREAVVIVAEIRHARRVPAAADLNRLLQQRLGIVADTFVFIRARTIPKTSSGKIARHLARRHWLDHELQVHCEVSGDAGRNPAAGTELSRLLGRFGLTGTETCALGDAGFDSIRLVEFTQALKDLLERQDLPDVSHAVDLRVLQKITISELVALLEQALSAAPHAALRLRRALSDLGREHRAAEAEMMRRDTRLRFDPATLPRPAAHVHGGGVLLTGGTGFFGPFLLASLLEQTSEDIHVLVRAPGEDQAMRRICQGLHSIAPNGWAHGADWTRRVRPVCGDLSEANLGLSSDAWAALAASVHTIYHNGALVNYLLDYQSMRDANVGGTNEVVKLAWSCRAKVLNYISTTFIYGWSVKDTLFESDTNAAMEHLDFGYSQSKWVSEQVVHDAMRRGLHARIFRPALLTPSLDGGGYNFDVSIRLLAFMINHGIGTTARNQVSFTPADLAARNIVAICQLPDSLGGAYHVTRDQFASMPDITAILSVLAGPAFRNYSLKAFVPEVIERCHSGDILFPLVDFLVRSVDNITAMEFKRYDNRRYREMRDRCGAGAADPPLDDVVLGILRFLRKQNLVTV